VIYFNVIIVINIINHMMNYVIFIFNLYFYFMSYFYQ